MSRRFFFLPFLFLIGCTPSAPDGFPALTPCTVSVTDGGAPVADCLVQIVPEPRLDSVATVGRTDEAGKAKMFTSFGTFHREGVPVGSLRMILVREPPLPHFKSEEERESMTDAQAEKYTAEVMARHAKLPRVLPTALSSLETTPLTRQAEPGKALTWDVELSEFR